MLAIPVLLRNVDIFRFGLVISIDFRVCKFACFSRNALASSQLRSV